MYIEKIEIRNFRIFRKTEIDFLYKERPETEELGKSKYPNINVILGVNGYGKSTLLKAIALAALGPAVADSGIYPYHLVRKEPEKSNKSNAEESIIEATFIPHEQDEVEGFERIESEITILKKGDLEQLRWSHQEEKQWHPIFSATSDAFFFVGYGTNRPLIVGSVEWMNIINMGADKHQASKAKRIAYEINGLDADQILISDFFGLNSTRTEKRSRKLKKLTIESGKGNETAAEELLKMLVNGQ